MMKLGFKGLAFCGLVIGSLFGCNSVGQQFLSSPSEHHQYRRAKSEEELGQRLGAAQAYLERYPEGRYAPELRAWFNTEEPAYYARLSKRRAGLLKYLEDLPSGPSAQAARDRLAEFQFAGERSARRETQLSERAAEFEGNLRRAEEQRGRVVEVYRGWVSLLAGIDSWGQRTSALDGELLRRWRVEEPAARCRGDVCTKFLQLDYSIPSAGKLRARSLVFDVQLKLEQGALQQAQLTGSQLFDRLSEALTLRPVLSSDALARAEGIAQVAQLTEQLLEPRFPYQRCAAAAVSPVVLARECDGKRVQLIAASEPGEEDRLVFGPLN